MSQHVNVTYLIYVNLDNVYKYVCRPATRQLLLRYDERHNSSVETREHNKYSTLNPRVFITLRIQITKLKRTQASLSHQVLNCNQLKPTRPVPTLLHNICQTLGQVKQSRANLIKFYAISNHQLIQISIHCSTDTLICVW